MDWLESPEEVIGTALRERECGQADCPDHVPQIFPGYVGISGTATGDEVGRQNTRPSGGAVEESQHTRASHPLASRGLGNGAGDQLNAASDLGVPVVGVGLLYHQGYFRQVIDRDGAQQALFSYNDPGQLPITPVRSPTGAWAWLDRAVPEYWVWPRAW